MNMTLQSSIKDRMLEAQKEASVKSAGLQRGIDKMIKLKNDGALKCHSLIMWAEVGEGHFIGPKLVQETTEKISQIKDRLKVVRDRQKIYADKRMKPLEFSIGTVVYRLDLPEELNGVHDTFHVLNLRKYLADPTLQVPLDEIRVDVKLNFMEEPEFKKLKRSRIAIVKVRWNSKRGPEFMWKHEDQMNLKYSHLFSADSS
ncbi:hypothetical protein Tco_0501819 [Tanacetum coccineum]